MKLYLLYLLFFPSIVAAQTINFPDINFKNYLLSIHSLSDAAKANWTYDNPGAAYNIRIDADNDGEIQMSEALSVSYLNISGNQITNLSGIEHFTNLHYLDVGQVTQNALIGSVNLASFPQLESLSVYRNQLTSINLLGLTNLKFFNCYYNQITTLDFTGLVNLKIVYCSKNQLTSLDFMGNPMLEDLSCALNPNLTTIKIKNGRTHLFGSASFINECWFSNPSLSYICADANEIPALQSFLSGCSITQPITIDSSCALGIDDFSLQSVNVYPNPATNIFYINNLVSKVMIYNLTGQLVKQFDGNFESNSKYDIQDLSKGVYLVKVFDYDNNEKKLKLIKE